MSESVESVDNQYICDYCGGEYSGKGGLRTHMTVKHLDEISTDVRCTWCGEQMTVKEWEVPGRFYCARKCSKAWTSYLRRLRGNLSEEMNEEDLTHFKNLVRNRDGHECLRCGEERKKGKRNLHVHHVVPRVDAAGDPHDPRNLVTVCPRCHRQLEGRDPDQQINECSISDKSELELSEEAWAFFDRLTEGDDIPEPRIGMFGEAQKMLAAGGTGDEYDE